jgi:hypothetical protein
VPGTVDVVLALGTEHEAVEASGLADGIETTLAAGKQFVYVGLMADVEDEAVDRRVEDVVKSDSQLDDAKIGPDVSAGLGDSSDEALANLFSEAFELDRRQPLYVDRRFDFL